MSSRVLWTICAISLVVESVVLLSAKTAASTDGDDPGSRYVVFGYNDLGIHCMNEDFSEFMILPPYNTLHAQVVDKSGRMPRIVSEGIKLSYEIPGNTYSITKTNFWDYAEDLLGVQLEPNVGLTGLGLSGQMTYSGAGDWVAAGIPLTPITDAGLLNPYQLAVVTVNDSITGRVRGRTSAVVPVSWEINCADCHHEPWTDARRILEAHDARHGTDLMSRKPILCGECHAQPELGLSGKPGIPTLSSSMHSAHAPRMGDVVDMMPDGVTCYACHPGAVTKCYRDVHYAAGLNDPNKKIVCVNCHAPNVAVDDYETAMNTVGAPERRPWTDEPRCSNCHSVIGHDYEQPNTRYRDSKGHGGMYCEACHGSPHAITPTTVEADNLQAIRIQGKPGTIKKCEACHTGKVLGRFSHKLPVKR